MKFIYTLCKCKRIIFIYIHLSVAAHIFNPPTCKGTIISLEPCALNADFQHFIPRFNKISLLCGYPRKKGLR